MNNQIKRKRKEINLPNSNNNNSNNQLLIIVVINKQLKKLK